MTVQEELFYGVPGIEFIWNGAVSDPHVKYSGKTYNYYDLEDNLYYSFETEIDVNGLFDSEIEAMFEDWVSSNPDHAYDTLYVLTPLSQAFDISDVSTYELEDIAKRVYAELDEDDLQYCYQNNDWCEGDIINEALLVLGGNVDRDTITDALYEEIIQEIQRLIQHAQHDTMMSTLAGQC